MKTRIFTLFLALTLVLLTLASCVSEKAPAEGTQGGDTNSPVNVNIYTLNGVVASTVQGVKDMKQNFEDQLYELNDEVFYSRSNRHGRSGSCGCGGNREFKQTSTYNLASTNVTVEENCRN